MPHQTANQSARPREWHSRPGTRGHWVPRSRWDRDGENTVLRHGFDIGHVSSSLAITEASISLVSFPKETHIHPTVSLCVCACGVCVCVCVCVWCACGVCVCLCVRVHVCVCVYLREGCTTCWQISSASMRSRRSSIAMTTSSWRPTSNISSTSSATFRRKPSLYYYITHTVSISSPVCIITYTHCFTLRRWASWWFHLRLRFQNQLMDVYN